LGSSTVGSLSARRVVGTACFALVFVASLSATPFGTASGAAIPNLVPEGELAWANSLLSMSGWTSFRFVLSDRALTAILIAWALMFFAVNIVTVANVPSARDFHVGSFGYGVIESMYAGGSLIGAFIGRWIPTRTR
jgi:hypothetical protein